MANDFVQFTNKVIGQGYYTKSDFQDILTHSTKNNLCTSYVARESGSIIGVRITFPPGKWTKGRGNGLSPKLWKVPIESVGYFQSLFLNKEARGKGLGVQLSLKSIESLKALETKAVVCHSWVESPGNSSRKYLKKLGFETVKTYERYWFDVDYTCPRCGKPCTCTAEEMILYLD